MAGLAAALLPHLPALLEGALTIIKEIRAHPDTPPELQAQLAHITAQLDATVQEVLAVRV